MSTFPNVRPYLPGGNRWPDLLAGLLLISFLAGPAAGATAANFVIPAGTASYTFNGATQGVQPGQVIELAAGVHGPRTFRNIVGTASQPVIIRSAAGGQAVVRRGDPASGGFVFGIRASRHFVLDGGNISTTVSGYPYGIKIMYASNATATSQDAPSAFLKTMGDTTTPQVFNNCSDFSIRHVEIDGGWPTHASDGIGITTNDHQFKAINYPGARQENIVIEHTFVHNTQGEGYYIGPNYYGGGVPLRNVDIRHNVVSDTAWDGIQLKSPIEGDNRIHHNYVRNVGRESDPASQGEIFGISLLDGSGDIYNNFVESSGDTAIQHWIPDLPSSFGAQRARIYNNVVIDPGVIGLTARNGISSGGSATNRVGEATASTFPIIVNNTIVRANGWAISISASAAGGSIKDNIIVDAVAGAIKAPATVTINNNLIGKVSDVGFVDPPANNYRLASHSVARNTGINEAESPQFDFDDLPRPQDIAPDRGAFEFRSESDRNSPAPPQEMTVR